MSKSEPKPKKRAPELVAAGAALAIGKLDETIERAKQTLKEKETEKKAILDGLDPEARVFLDRLRGTAKVA
jgi:hypothetical protein